MIREQFSVGFQFRSEPWWLAQLLYLIPTNYVGSKNSPLFTMYELSTYLVVPLFCYLAVYTLDLFLIEWDTKIKSGNNSVEDPSTIES